MNPGALQWDELEHAGARALGDIRVYETDVAADAGTLLLGLDAEGLRHLLIPIGEEDTVREDRRSRGVHLENRTLIDQDSERRFGDVVCRTPHLNELFGVLTDEMAAGIVADPDAPIDACLGVLDRWRELLERESTKLLGPQQIAAIFAELWNLRRLVARDPGAASFWTGPAGGIHDISTPNGAIEVKSTTARYGRVVEIHGQEQLRPPENGNLYLAVMRLEVPASDGDSTLPSLVRELLDLGADRHELLQRLSRVGYRLDDETAYSSLPVAVLEDRVYAVDAGLPSIVPATFVNGHVPAGVVRLVYSIDLTGEPPTPLDPEAVDRLADTLTS